MRRCLARALRALADRLDPASAGGITDRLSLDMAGPLAKFERQVEAARRSGVIE